MDPFLIIVILISMVYTALMAFIGFFLVKRARRLQLPNLYWLVLFFFLNAFAVFLEFFGAGMLIIYSIAHAPLLGFAYYTFTIKKEIRIRWHLSLNLVLQIFILIWENLARIESSFYPAALVATAVAIFHPAFYLGRAVHNAQETLKKGFLEPWVHVRYELLEWSSYLLSVAFVPVTVLFLTTGSHYMGYELITACIELTFVFVQLLCWLMPPWFKAFIVRRTRGTAGDTQETVDVSTMDEDELLEKLKKQFGESKQYRNNNTFMEGDA